jgi:hypothetical protein
MVTRDVIADRLEIGLRGRCERTITLPSERLVQDGC